MKKFFIVLGSIFLAILVLGGIGIAYFAVRGNTLDKESKAYADTVIPAIVTNWNEKELLDRASPEFKKVATQEQVDRLFHWFSSLGRLRKCDPAQGQAGISITPQTGKIISAEYTAKAKFEKGEAAIKLGLVKHGDQWQILNFHVSSPALLPQ